jgi:hypothetical protein
MHMCSCLNAVRENGSGGAETPHFRPLGGGNRNISGGTGGVPKLEGVGVPVLGVLSVGVGVVASLPADG